MRITLLTPGTGSYFCGACLRDGALARALRRLEHDALLVPLYLPLMLEDHEIAGRERVRMGGLNLYLEQKVPRLMRWVPGWLTRLLDSPGLLRWLASHAHMTEASSHGAMTVSMLRGEEGSQARELDRLADWLAGERAPEVIGISNVLLVGMARRLKERLDRPIVCSLHGEAPFLDALAQPFRDQAWEVLRERVHDVDMFVAVSHYYRDLMMARLGLAGEHVRVVYNGIDLDGVEPAPPDGAPQRPTVGYLARMCADKGLHTLVEAFLELKRRGRPDGLRLRVAGAMLRHDRPFVDELKRRLEQAGCAADAEFLPNIGRAEKLAFLHSLSVFSVPATYGESFGLYLLEALAHGVPVVQPRHGAFPEIVAMTGGGVLCEPDDVPALADALEQLLLDEERRRALGERGKAAVVQEFGAERMAREIVEVCQQVMS